MIKVDQNFSLILLCHIIYFFFEHVPTIFFWQMIKNHNTICLFFKNVNQHIMILSKMLAMLVNESKSVSIYPYMYMYNFLALMFSFVPQGYGLV